MVVGSASGTGGQSEPGSAEASALAADRIARSELVGRTHELGRRAAEHLAHRVGLGER